MSRLFRSCGRPDTMGDLEEQLKKVLGPSRVLVAGGDVEGYLVDQRRLVRGRCRVVALPGSTAEVSQVVRIAREHGVSVVPHGGNTSYVGAATPDESGTQIVLSLERFNKIRSIDPLGFTLSADAGVILANAQAAAAEHGLLLPLSLGAEGSCQIGGNAATNAGGVTALRYGVTRDLVLGLEVVMPDGSVLDEMRSLRKDNTGYDLRHLFVGSEGTLGIITGVVFKLFHQPRRRATAWIALRRAGGLAPLLAEVRRESAELLSSFEYMSADSLHMAAVQRGGSLPLPIGEAGALLVELNSSSEAVELETLLAAGIERATGEGLLGKTVLAGSVAQRRELWAIREGLPEAEKHAGQAVKHDISVPISMVDTYLEAGRQLVKHFDPEFALSIYGHVGDGNIHFNVMVPRGADRMEFSAQIERSLSIELYDLASSMGGSFSAEHGVGRVKRALLERYSSDVKLRSLTALKMAIDPDKMLNPLAMV